jgi:quercetin dioxygenase-like cupin family protein
VVEGDRMLVALINKPRGTGSRIHTHKNEQFNYVLRGTLRCEVDGVKHIAGPGTLIYIPANTPHATIATPDEDVVFLAIKDQSASIIGTPVDRSVRGAHYDPGFGPKRKKPTSK